ncbi:mannose-ethanolamine phosphotransferase gpi13 [Rhodotorula toruloides]|uniref:FGENESH: predicted gene_2.465 protein n=1 Tax=Rhodotorula toruloides TaxID=5286 RepID=A0A0K3CA79_RHOTO|nr:hypothetical protein AAT19DRAFT_12437 [Rhodotorula toruloides]
MASQAAATSSDAPGSSSVAPATHPRDSALFRARRWLHVLPFLPAGSTYLSALTLLALLHTIGLLLFTRGFLLTRKALPNVNTCNPTAPSGNLDPSCSLPPTHDKLIFLVVDALRADFVLPVDEPANPFYSNRIPLPAHLTRTQPTNSFLSHFIADAPTTTLQRLKGMTTGSLPTFIDAGSNFAGEQADEDNWLGQAKRAGKRIALVGDETWLNVFPRGKDSVWQEGLVWPYDSFDVEDLDTVDRGVREHLLELLEERRQREWDIVIAHALGLDHAGHRFGAEHRETTRKLRETEQLLRDVVERMQEDTLLVVVGDHGMTDRGDHGGDSREEVDAALWVYSKTPLTDSTWYKHDLASTRHPLASLYAAANGSSDLGDRFQLTWREKGLSQATRSVSQIDLVPTIALLLGLPIPFGNLGLPIPELFFRNVDLPVAPKPSAEAASDKPKRGFFGFASSQPERRDQDTLSPLQTVLQATLLASSELSNYLLTYTALPSGKDLVPVIPELSFILEIAKSAYKGAHAPGHSREEMELRALEKFWTFERKAREKARLVWARFDPVLMGAGLAVWTGSLVVAWRLANAAKKGPSARFLVGRAVEGGLIALAAGLVLSTRGVFKGRPSGLAAAFAAAVGAELAVVFAPSTSPLSLTTRLRGALAQRTPASLLPLVAHAALLASNSLTVFEDRIVLYLLATLLSFSLVRGFAAPEARLKNRIVAYSAIALVSLRLMSWSTICREEQVPKCHPTFHLTPGSTSSIVVLVLSVAAAIGVPSILRSSLATSKSDEGVAPAFLGVGIRTLLLGASAYWVADSLLASSSFGTAGTAVASLAKTAFARAALVGGFLSATLVWYLSPLCIRVQREQVRNAAGEPIRTQIKVIGFANALGSSYLLFFATVFVLLFLVSPPPAQLILTLHLVILLCLLEIFDSERDVHHLTTALTSAASLEAFLNSDEGGLPPPPPHTGPTFVQISMLALLAHLSFFSTGHQAVISSIQWSTAFIGFPSLTYPFSPILVTLNTLAGFVLTAAALPLFVFWNLSPTLKDQGAPMVVGRNLLRAGASYMAYFAALALASATCSAWLRRHLMVWKIFAPRFMLAGVALLATDFVVVVLAMAWGARGVLGKVRGSLGTRFAE